MTKYEQDAQEAIELADRLHDLRKEGKMWISLITGLIIALHGIAAAIRERQS